MCQFYNNWKIRQVTRGEKRKLQTQEFCNDCTLCNFDTVASTVVEHAFGKLSNLFSCPDSPLLVKEACKLWYSPSKIKDRKRQGLLHKFQDTQQYPERTRRHPTVLLCNTQQQKISDADVLLFCVLRVETEYSGVPIQWTLSVTARIATKSRQSSKWNLPHLRRGYGHQTKYIQSK